MTSVDVVQLVLLGADVPAGEPPRRVPVVRRAAACLPLVGRPGWLHLEVEQGTLWAVDFHQPSVWVWVPGIKRVPATLGYLLQHRMFVADYLSRVREHRGKSPELLAWMKELEQYGQRLEAEILRRKAALGIDQEEDEQPEWLKAS